MFKGAKILVVDDEPRNVKLLAAYLRNDGFEPIGTTSGQEALQLASSMNPDVILLDIMMPDMDGFEVTRRIKANPVTQHIPVVLVTSLDGSDHRVKGLDAGADEFLSKPVNRTEVLVRVRALQRMKQMQDELRNRKLIASRLRKETVSNMPTQPTVLIVEDDLSLGKQINDVLSAEDFNTAMASSAAELREILANDCPHIVLLDRLLPDADGMNVLEEMKENERFSAIPVIIITALPDLEEKIKGIEQGADDYLIKPIENNELLARVRASLRRAASEKNLRQDIVQLMEDTITDRLTLVRNRQYLDADLEHRFAQSRRDTQRVLSVIMLDIDYFKQINDQYGHLAGDLVLRQVAQQLQQTARAADIVTRYGGEEFCIVLPETDQEDAKIAATRLCNVIANHDFNDIDKQVTVSLGVATYCADDGCYTDLLARADAALYVAKGAGRNRICTAEDQKLVNVLKDCEHRPEAGSST